MQRRAISSIVFLPSEDHVECTCRSPRTCLTSTSSGSSPLRAGVELAEVLAELGRDVLVAEELVELGLVARREDLARLDGLDAVLGDREPLLHGGFAQRDVVVLRAGEVLEQVPERLGRDHAQVEAQAVVRDDRRLRVSVRGDLRDPLERDEVVDQRARVLRRGDHVEVAEGLLAAADAPRLRDEVRGGMRAKRPRRPRARARAPPRAAAAPARASSPARARAGSAPRSARRSRRASGAAPPLPPCAGRRRS